MRQKFVNPPINEVVLSAFFDPPLKALLAQHIGLFWQEILEEFPGSAQQPIVGDFELHEGSEIFPLPRFWFVSKDETLVIQIQRDAFMLNWRRKDADYPHYEIVKSEFDRLIKIYFKFLERHELAEARGYARLELAYINLIDEKSGWSTFEDTKKILPSFSSFERSVPGASLSSFNMQNRLTLSDNLNLSLIAQSRTHRDTGSPILYFELRCFGVPDGDDVNSVGGWFDAAHEAIGSAFLSLTSDDVQANKWQPVSDSGG